MAALALTAFEQAAKKLSPGELEVWVGRFNDCTVLKLYKPTWANAGEDPLTASSRIFFSVWIAPAKEGRLLYNIHAFKLRKLKGYRLESRRFAAAFRAAFLQLEKSWPHARTDLGPLTLMEGYVAIEPERLEDQILGLSKQFVEIAYLVDETLEMFR